MKQFGTRFDSTLWWLAPIALAMLVVGFRFSGFFYSTTIGNDYAFSMPRLLDGYYWFRNNGILPQWYTAAFCGGLVAYADAQSMYYSIFQLLTIPFGPRHAVFWGVLLHAAAGGVGMTWMLRACFNTTRFAAALGGVLFIANGFFWARAMSGHVNWVQFTFVPLIAVLLLKASLGGARYSGGVLAGLVIASFTYAGALTSLFPTLLAVALMLTIAFAARSDVDIRQVLLNTAIAGCIALLVSASKLWAVMSFVRHFPRNYYALPGFDSIPALLASLSTSLFTLSFSEGHEFGQHLVNSTPIASREEWDFSVGLVPLLLVLGAVLTRRLSKHNASPAPRQIHWLAALATCILLLLPIVANFYSPGWNHFLKSLPVIGSMSLLVRYWVVYIPVIIVVSVLWADRSGFLRSRTAKAALLVLSLCWAGARDWDSGLALAYDPKNIERAYRETRAGTKTPGIATIGVFVNEKREAFSPVGRDDVISENVSQLLCYQPHFGYFLERFPMAGLTVGSIYAEKNGFLNLKNPACYTEGEANGCAPGAHFKASELGSARALASYRSYGPAFSLMQKFANVLSLVTLLGAMAWLARGIWRRARQRGPGLT
jgi:hypothetical protein